MFNSTLVFFLRLARRCGNNARASNRAAAEASAKTARRGRTNNADYPAAHILIRRYGAGRLYTQPSTRLSRRRANPAPLVKNHVLLINKNRERPITRLT